MGNDYRDNRNNNRNNDRRRDNNRNQQAYHQPRNAPQKVFLPIGQTIYFHATIKPEKQDTPNKPSNNSSYVKCKGSILRQPNDYSNPLYKVIVSDVCLVSGGATEKEKSEVKCLIGKKFLRKDEQLFLSAPDWWSGGGDWTGGNTQKISEAINRFKNRIVIQQKRR